MIEQAIVHEHRKVKSTSIVCVHVVAIKLFAVLVQKLEQFAEGVAAKGLLWFFDGSS